MAHLLKDLYTKEYIHKLATLIKQEYLDFDILKFEKKVFDKSWINKELKQRMRHIAISMNDCLPFNFSKQIDILKPASTYFRRMEAMFFQDFVEVYGMEFWNKSMEAMEHFTKYGSSEFAIRQFILKDEKKAMQQMLAWSKSTNVHIRRLASEGCRSRLPWAIALPTFKKDPSEVIKILNILKEDDEKYVQKSVANNLNDISKDNPKLIINLTRKWYNQNKNTNWILQHGCRTLLKSGNQDILKIFGYKQYKELEIKNFKCKNIVHYGDNLEFSFDLQSTILINKLRIEFKIDFVRLHNKKSTKVFQLRKLENFIGVKSIQKIYSFKQINTRNYYKGTHKLYIIINGKIIEETKFNLV